MFVFFSLSMKEYSVKQFVFLLAACVYPDGILSAVSADESQPISLTADEIVLEKEVTVSSADSDDLADSDDASVRSGLSITATVNSAGELVEVNDEEAAVEGVGAAPDAGVPAVPPHKQIVIRLSGKADKDSAFATIGDDSQMKIHTKGKIVVVGPDGKRQEFAISGNEAGKVFKIVTGDEATDNSDQTASHIDSLVRVLKLQHAPGTGSDGEPVSETRLAIGVQCEDVPEALRSHLEMGEKGIMVGHVREKTPASEAALMKFDIILQIGDKDVATTDDLVSSVAASEGRELTLSIIRHGEPMKVVVTPRQLEFPVLLAPAQAFLFHEDLAQDSANLADHPAWQSLPESVRKELESHPGVQNSVRKFHPGIVIEQRVPSNDEDMQELIEQTRKLAEGSRKIAQRKAQDALEAAESAVSGKLAGSMETLRDQVRALEQKLEQLEKRLATEPEDEK